jgi:hypothetical protein
VKSAPAKEGLMLFRRRDCDQLLSSAADPHAGAIDAVRADDGIRFDPRSRHQTERQQFVRLSPSSPPPEQQRASLKKRAIFITS